MTQLIVDFRNFSKVPKIILRHCDFLYYYHVHKKLAWIIQIRSVFYGSVDPPRTRPRASNKTKKKGAQSFSPDFSLSTQLLFMCASGLLTCSVFHFHIITNHFIRVISPEVTDQKYG